ncbi:MAG: hypothetical protein ACD_2C00199G0001 [uncultured bacterium (gcode 4)]|uniref:Uncharacterized protein n=1 Tax=uncultured bacterium (gcode 4) TaxID=1234023 RepID=K2G4K1_9BACT|nr:MAG: hypothetical protein ACD_2C00199G0001 [uncultured bacterium (gcode 4)]
MCKLIFYWKKCIPYMMKKIWRGYSLKTEKNLSDMRRSKMQYTRTILKTTMT